MIPECANFRPEWLDSSEVSLALPDLRVAGLSFFFQDEASWGEFAAAGYLDESVRSDDKALREKFSILPRHWLKIHFSGGKRRGLSQYFHIDPAMHYPITTIRCFLRKYGMSDVGMIETLLKPALEAEETEWGLAIKRYPGLAVPRIFFSITRPLLKQVLAPCVLFGCLSEAAEQLYLQWEQRIVAGDRVFISLDPTLGRLSSLDFCDVPAHHLAGSRHLPDTLDYLKLRLVDASRPPELTAYLPYRKASSLTLSP